MVMPSEIYTPEPVDPRAPIWTIEALKLVWWTEFCVNMHDVETNMPCEYKSAFMVYTRSRILGIQTYEEMDVLIHDYHRMSLSEWTESYGRAEHNTFNMF